MFNTGVAFWVAPELTTVVSYTFPEWNSKVNDLTDWINAFSASVSTITSPPLQLKIMPVINKASIITGFNNPSSVVNINYENNFQLIGGGNYFSAPITEWWIRSGPTASATFSNVGSTLLQGGGPTSQVRSSVMGNDGNIYQFSSATQSPNHIRNQIYKYGTQTSSNTIGTITRIATTGSNNTGESIYAACRGFDDTIYMLGDTYLIEYNTLTSVQTRYTHGIVAAGTYKFSSIIQWTDGNLYITPRGVSVGATTQYVWKFSNTTKTITSSYSITNLYGWSNPMIGPDGLLYFTTADTYPSGLTTPAILQLNPSGPTWSTFGFATASTQNNHPVACFGADGKIYVWNRQSGLSTTLYLTRHNIQTKTSEWTSITGAVLSQSAILGNGKLLADGNIYILNNAYRNDNNHRMYMIPTSNTLLSGTYSLPKNYILGKPLATSGSANG